MKNYVNKTLVLLGFIMIAVAFTVAHDALTTVLAMLGINLALCFFVTLPEGKYPPWYPAIFFTASLVTMIDVLLLYFNVSYIYMAIPSLIIIVHMFVSCKNSYKDIVIWILAMLLFYLLMIINGWLYFTF